MTKKKTNIMCVKGSHASSNQICIANYMHCSLYNYTESSCEICKKSYIKIRNDIQGDYCSSLVNYEGVSSNQGRGNLAKESQKMMFFIIVLLAAVLLVFLVVRILYKNIISRKQKREIAKVVTEKDFSKKAVNERHNHVTLDESQNADLNKTNNSYNLNIPDPENYLDNKLQRKQSQMVDDHKWHEFKWVKKISLSIKKWWKYKRYNWFKKGDMVEYVREEEDHQNNVKSSIDNIDSCKNIDGINQDKKNIENSKGN